jgi:diaminohydroxyphosphoribosylaminopyrimidine deaminase / 5-amino-6-(5-phosphoribosylamino)uracil reductase
MTETSRDRPCVTLKLATSLDGRIATRSGQSQWITGPEARAQVHTMRAAHDCVLTGIGTVLADDPELTARTDPKPSFQPVRAVLDSNARTPLSSKLIATCDQGPVCLFHDKNSAATFDDRSGLQRVHVSQDEEGLNLREVLTALQGAFGVQSIMVEAGSHVAGAFLRAGLVDTLVWFRASLIIGGDGLSVFSSLNVDALADALAFDRVDIVTVGADVMETYRARLQN